MLYEEKISSRKKGFGNSNRIQGTGQQDTTRIGGKYGINLY